MNELTQVNTSTGEIMQGNAGLEAFLVGYEQRLQIARVLLASGFLPPAYKTPEQVLATMLTAHELNIPTMMALRTVDIIQNQPTLSPELMLALIRRSRELEDMHIKDDGRTCYVTMKRRGEQAHTESFGMDNAERMLTAEWRDNKRITIKLSEKHNWKSMPETMRKWRAVGACAKIVFPDVLGGMYLREEVQDQEDALDVAEIRHDDEPQAEKPKPVEVAAGVTLPAFDPQAERITFGKYGPAADTQGLFWCELPPDYVAWVSTMAKNKADKERALATLAFFDAREAQKPPEDVIETMFPKEEQKA